MVKHAVYIALVEGQGIQKETTSNVLIMSSALHDITIDIYFSYYIGLSYTEKEVA